MESVGHHVAVPMRVGGKKMRKRRELDALVAHSLAKGSKSSGRHIASNGVASHDQLLSNSTDEQEDYSWPKVRTQSRCRSKRFSCLRTCGPLLFVSCIFISLGFMYWLYFDIRQQISQYRIRIEQVSATSQNVPEALQKWHETSKNLEQNQTALNGKLRDMQQRLTSFHEDLKQFREALEKKKENSQEAQFNRLTASVADLGSNIGESKSRITVLETQISTIQDDQKQLNKTLDDIQKLFGRLQNSSAGSGIIGGSGAQDLEKTIADLREQLTGRLDKLAENVTGELQTLRQKNIWLVADLANHTKRIEQLIDNTANISSEVSSIESVWLDIRNNMSGLEADRKTINDQLAALANVTTGLHGTIAKVQEECQQYHSKLDGVNGKLGAMQDQIQQLQESKQAMHRPPIVQEQEQQRLINTTHQENLPAALSKIFEDQPPIVEVERMPVTIKPSDTTSSTTDVHPRTGTPVMQPATTPKPTGTTEAKATEVASGGGSPVSKKAAATFDSVM
ncbi:uncharacterized protein LOC126576046 isoform X2 [Anopheles aquasalis]|uniref:uncharacterized protein LOC126576046 isoform X2 n=1 Tax=Anopheles aquasalis TaxID=42839 RepID=UPI00215B1532|nr:uncharacterized protein LOC126576046 isoform X2 [Anopheles aquasalis]